MADTKLRRIIISGGGVAGAALACALTNEAEDTDLSITILEKDFEGNVGSVKRGEAIRPEVVKALHEIGLLEYVKRRKPVEVTRPKQEVWHSLLGKLGSIDYGVLERNYPMMFLPHHEIVQSLYDRLRETKVSVLYGAETTGVKIDSDGKPSVMYNQKRLELGNDKKKDSEEKKISTDFLVVAEGGSSMLRDSLGIGVDMVDYKVGYLMVMMDKLQDMQWSRHYLTPEGFVGLFPISLDRMRAAVEIDVSQLKGWLSVDKNQIKQRIAFRIGMAPEVHDLGVFYRVIRRHASNYFCRNAVLIGDAAHTTHPMMGQGMSMVFHDISVLSKLILEKPELREEELSKFEMSTRIYNSTIIQNNHDLFEVYTAIGKDPSKMAQYHDILSRIGFVPESG